MEGIANRMRETMLAIFRRILNDENDLLITPLFAMISTYVIMNLILNPFQTNERNDPNDVAGFYNRLKTSKMM